MADVFISYSRKDTDFVDGLIEFFDRQQVSYYRDTKDLPPAVIWREELRNAIIDADNLLFIISPDSVDSEYCRMELEFAAEHCKRLIPVQYRFTEEPEIPLQLAKWQMLEFDSSARDKMLNDMLMIIRREREWRKQGSDYLRRAENWHDGKYLATTSRDKTARVWESLRGREVLRLLEAEQGSLSQLHFHRNERHISAQHDRGFSTWEVTGHRQSRSNLPAVGHLCKCRRPVSGYRPRYRPDTSQGNHVQPGHHATVDRSSTDSRHRIDQGHGLGNQGIPA